MTTIRNTAIAAIAAVTIAASMASPANALNNAQKLGIAAGVFALGAAAAGAHAHGYHGHYGHGYYGHGRYKRISRKCARRWGWHTWRYDRCLDHHGY